jgi:hypothetical protein
MYLHQMQQQATNRTYDQHFAIIENNLRKSYKNCYERKNRKRKSQRSSLLTQLDARKYDTTDLNTPWERLRNESWFGLLSEPAVAKNDIGQMSEKCIFCGAWFWDKERKTDGVFNRCCQEGKIPLFLNEATPLMSELFEGQSPRSQTFLKYSRWFNSQLSFAAISMKNANIGGGLRTVVIHDDAVYHRVGSILLPLTNRDQPLFQQIYLKQMVNNIDSVECI